MGCFSSKAGPVLDKHGQLSRHSGAKQSCWPAPRAADVAAPGSGADWAGLFKVTVDYARLNRRGHYNVTLSMGLQSFVSKTSPWSDKPQFGAERNFAVVRNDSHQLHFVVHRIRSKFGVITPVNCGYAHIDLLKYFEPGVGSGTLSKLDVTESLTKSGMLVLSADEALPDGDARSDVPRTSTPDQVYTLRLPLHSMTAAAAELVADSEGDDEANVEYIQIRVQTANLEQVEETFWKQLVELVDWDNSGTLDEPEFMRLMQGVMDPADSNEKLLKDLWHDASVLEESQDGVTSAGLAKVITERRQRDGLHLLRRCPISGATLSETDDLGNFIYILFQMDAGMGKNLQGGTYRTAAQANQSWIMKLSEWAMEPLSGNYLGIVQRTHRPGLNTHRNAAHIVVYNRYSQVLEEELIAPIVVLAMRNMYQSTFGALMKSAGAYRYLQTMSDEKGRYMDSPASKGQIRKFLKSYQGQILIDDIAEDLDSFPTFNAFFYRKLKPGCRPIADARNDSVMISAADCRLIAFENVDESRKFWIKGRRFSVAGLLGDADLAKDFTNPAILIFRLAPQDYHRFHSPVSGVVESITPIAGQLYTVNPIAVNSPLVNVFTDNKRVVVLIRTTQFGLVAFVAIGATLVGSILITAGVGSHIEKGDELGYFAFGGSTCVTLVREGRVQLDMDVRRIGSRSIEMYVRMGDRIAIRQDHTATTTTGRDLPLDIVEQTSDIAQMRQCSDTTTRLDMTAEAMFGEECASSDRGENGDGEREPPGASASDTARAHWAHLSACEAWKDKQFLKELVDDSSSTGELSKLPSRASLHNGKGEPAPQT